MRVLFRSWRPPGRLHWPTRGGRARWTSSTSSPRQTTTPTPTFGRSGYSRLVMAPSLPVWRSFHGTADAGRATGNRGFAGAGGREGRKSVGVGRSGSVRVGFVGCAYLHKKKKTNN